MGYEGKRVLTGWKHYFRMDADTIRILKRTLFFPVTILYLELVLHLYMGMALRYAPVYILFGGAAGLLCTAVCVSFPEKANHIIMKALTTLLCLVFGVELIAKKILQSYYPLSTLGVAAGNRLSDYADVIGSTLVQCIPVLLVLIVPLVLLCVFGRKHMGYEQLDKRFAGTILAGVVILHLFGLGSVHLPWEGDLTPKQLYRVDTNIDDQVEQLGLVNMLRLDVQHLIIPPSGNLDDDFSGLAGLGSGDSSQSPSENEAQGENTGDSSEVLPPEPEIDTSPNVMDVDLTAIAQGTSDKDIQWLANYFNSVSPTKKNAYTGMFEGYNVIQIVMEGFSGYAIDPELTPTLYKLTHEGFVFNNYYTALHFTSTSNGECQTLLGLYPKNGTPITMKRTGELGTNAYFTLAQQLSREGYEVLGYHGNYEMYGRLASHTNLGYDWRQYQTGLELEMGSSKPLWPQRDSYVVEASIDDYINSDKPFHVYYLTISGHMPYSDNRIVAPYREIVRELPYSETTQNYVATAMEVDKMLETLLDKLEAAGKLDNTLIVATGDHIPYFNVDTLEELSGQSFGSSEAMEALDEENINFDVYRNSLILWSASMEESVEVDKVCCQVDILPTISNLLGLEYDSRMLAGSDIFSDSDGLVVFTSRCWKSDKGFYNRFTGEFTPAEGVSMTQTDREEYVDAMKKLVQYKLDSTSRIVENDFYDYFFGEK